MERLRQGRFETGVGSPTCMWTPFSRPTDQRKVETVSDVLGVKGVDGLSLLIARTEGVSRVSSKTLLKLPSQTILVVNSRKVEFYLNF